MEINKSFKELNQWSLDYFNHILEIAYAMILNNVKIETVCYSSFYEKKQYNIANFTPDEIKYMVCHAISSFEYERNRNEDKEKLSGIDIQITKDKLIFTNKNFKNAYYENNVFINGYKYNISIIDSYKEQNKIEVKVRKTDHPFVDESKSIYFYK